MPTPPPTADDSHKSSATPSSRSVALAVLVLTSAVAPATALAAGEGGEYQQPRDRTAVAEAATADPGPPGRGVIRTVRTFRATGDPGTVAVELSYETGEGVEEAYTVVPERYTVVDSGDFTRDTNDQGQTLLRWDGTPATPTATLRYRVNETGTYGDDALDAASWSLVAPGGMPTWVRTDGSVEPRWEIHNRVTGEGYAGPRLVYLGPHNLTWDTSVYSQVKVVVPAAVETANESAVVDAAVHTADFFGEAGITRATDAYNTYGRTTFVGGDETKGITAFVGPAPFSGTRGYAAGSNVFLTFDTTDETSQRRLVYHEFTHTVQAWRTGPSARWLTEGTAEYYQERLAFRFGDRSFADFRAALETNAGTTADGTVLADPATWRDTEANYDRGSVVYAALDARIRNATAGRRTVDDLTRRLNDHEGNVTNADLRRMAEATADREFDRFFRRYVTGDEMPPVPPVEAYAAGGPGRASVNVSVTTTRASATTLDAAVAVTNTGTEPLVLPAVGVEPSVARVTVTGPDDGDGAPSRTRFRRLAPGETGRVTVGLTGAAIAEGVSGVLRVHVANPAGEDATRTVPFRADPAADRENTTENGPGDDTDGPGDDDPRPAVVTASVLLFLGFGGLAGLFAGLGGLVLVGRGLDSLAGVVPAAVSDRSPRWFGKWALLCGLLAALAFAAVAVLG